MNIPASTQNELMGLRAENERLKRRMHELYELARNLAEDNGQLRNQLEELSAAEERASEAPGDDDTFALPHLRAWREVKGFQQGEFARSAGLWQKDISQIEHGKRRAYRSTAEKLATALGITFEELLGGPA